MSNVVGMSSGVGIGNGETSMDLSNGVGFSISLANMVDWISITRDQAVVSIASVTM